MSSKELREKEHWAKLEANDFNFLANARNGNAAASRFSRACAANAQLKADYEAVGAKDAELAAFRQRWAKDEHAVYLKTCEKTTVYKKATWTHGIYIPVGRIAHKEGGGKLGWLQAN